MAKFSFFEIVKITSSSNPETERFVGRTGVVIGMTPVREFENGEPDFSDVIDYGLLMDGEKYSWYFFPNELESTGIIGKREDYYGPSVRVGVNEKGEGFLLDKEPRNEEEAEARKKMGWD